MKSIFLMMLFYCIIGSCQTTDTRTNPTSSALSTPGQSADSLAASEPCIASPIIINSGQTVGSIDGCNSCTCNNGSFSCTELACEGGFEVPNSCEVGSYNLMDGQSMPASDGCNECTCRDGSLSCTELACAQTNQATPNLQLPSNTTNTTDIVDSSTDTSTEQAFCEVSPIKIEDGQSIGAGDGCNKCSCSNGGFACTEIACIDGAEDPGSCEVGEYSVSNGEQFKTPDDCNTCTCNSGSLVCTVRYCVQ